MTKAGRKKTLPRYPVTNITGKKEKKGKSGFKGGMPLERKENRMSAITLFFSMPAGKERNVSFNL